MPELGLPQYMDMSEEQRAHYDAVADPLGICGGCGQPDDVLFLVRDALENCNSAAGHWEKLDILLDARNDTRGYFMLCAIDKLGWIEHGTTIYCSWRTDKGDEALAHLNALFPRSDEDVK
jgi:hypothetical protein